MFKINIVRIARYLCGSWASCLFSCDACHSNVLCLSVSLASPGFGTSGRNRGIETEMKNVERVGTMTGRSVGQG